MRTDAEILRACDPGIRDAVQFLRSHGFNTTDSGDGVSKPEVGRTMEFRHVFMTVETGKIASEADRLFRLFSDDPAAHIEASYSPADGVAVLCVMWPPEGA